MPYASTRYKRKATTRRPAKRAAAAPARPRRPGYRRAAPRTAAPPQPYRRNPVATVRPVRAQVQRGYLPFAPRFFAKLPWSYTSSLAAPGTQLAGTVYYRLNSLYDPDYGAGGHQPMQFDQLCPGIYTRYHVKAAKVVLRFTNPSADGLYVGYNLYRQGQTNGNANGKSLGAIKEMRRAVMAPLNNTGSQTKVFTVYVPLYVLADTPKIVYDTDLDSYAAPYNQNPTGGELYVQPLVLDATGGTASVTFDITITYYAVLDQVEQQAQS